MIFFAVVVLCDTSLAVKVEIIGEAIAVADFTSCVIDFIELHDGLFATDNPACGSVWPPSVSTVFPASVSRKIEVSGTHTRAVNFIEFNKGSE